MKTINYLFYLIIIISFIFTSCTSTRLPRSGIQEIPVDYFGMVHAGESRDEGEYELLDEMGVVWLLNTFYWRNIEPRQGEFTFARYDPFVQKAKDNNKKVLAVLAYETPWIVPEGGKRRYISDENIPHFLNFVEETVRHYKGEVDAWQVWNEPNWIFWNGTKREFYKLSRLAAERIRETDPDAYIIGGGFWRTPKRFIRGMNRAGALKDLDALSFHPYGVTPRESMKLYDNLTRVLRRVKFNGEVWITEVGYPTFGRYPNKVSLIDKPSFVIKTITGSAGRGSRALFWYEFSDNYNEGEAPRYNDSEMFFGLTYPDRSRKKAAWAYELCARFLPGSTYSPQLPIRNKIPSKIVSFCFMDGEEGYNTLILWNDKRRAMNIRISAESPLTLHDISSGNNKILSNDITLSINRNPVFITWQGSSAPTLSRVEK